MKRLGALVIAVAAVIPAADSLALPDVPLDLISEPFVALRGADRIGNAAPVEGADPLPPITEPSVADVSPKMQRVLDLVNIERTSRGLLALRFSANLNDAALLHTLDQATVGDIFHFSPFDGSGPADRLDAVGYDYIRWGENVAAGQSTAAEVMQGWMASAGHCRNILNPAFTEIGIGYTSDGLRYGHFWTQKFARPTSDPQPRGEYNEAWC